MNGLKGTLLALLLAVSAGSAFAQGAATAAEAQSTYRINPGDVLHVFVWNEDTLTEDVIVQPDGYFNFPLAGVIDAGGRTTSQVERSIVHGLTKYMKDTPVVTVSLLKMDGNIVYVLGKVNRPGAYPVNRPVDVTQALAMAGGLNSFADENDIQVLRRGDNGKQKAIEFEYGDIKSGKHLDTNIVLKAGDVVVVP